MNAPSPVPLGLRGGPLADADYQDLALRWIDREHADRAFLRRVDSVTGAEEVAVDDPHGDYSGITIPYLWPGESGVRDIRLRRDHPEYETTSGGERKPKRKYVAPRGRGNMLYFPAATDADLLLNASVPLVIVEGEFKTISLWRLAWYGRGDAAEEPMFLPIGLSGVWNWRGRIGKETDETGTRVDQVGPIPDLDRINWDDRHVTIVFDPDVGTNLNVSVARDRLTGELGRRGARVHWFVWPKDTPNTIGGIDDYLAAEGPETVLRTLVAAKPQYKRKNGTAQTVKQLSGDANSQLIMNGRGELRPIVTNAIVLLQHSPEWTDVLAYDEFSMRIVVDKATPWGSKPEIWTPHDDSRTQEWLQRAGLYVGLDITTQALEHVAKLRLVHPVREYLDGLNWDGQRRMDTWLTTYLGVDDTEYVAAVGAKWLLSAVARIYKPGEKVDSCLILEGPQGIGKSTALRILAEPWYTDEIADLGSKDSSMQVSGVWVIEIAELDSMSRSEASRIKSFMSRAVDRYRPPYGKRVIQCRRQSVFAGTVNHDAYLRDETGGRRFWPVTCTAIDTVALARDRDQLWAEARTRFHSGEKWWLTEATTIRAATEQQRARYQPDPWQEDIERFAEDCDENGKLITIPAVLCHLNLDAGRRSQAEANRASRCLKAAGYDRKQVRDASGKQIWTYQKANSH